MVINRVQPVHVRCTPILPLVYDDSLSYMEVLYKVLAKTNECINTLNEVSGIVENHETRISALENEISAIRAELESFKVYVQKQIDDFEEKVNNDFARLEAEIRQELADTIATVNRQIASLEREFSRKFDALETELIGRINDALNQMDAELLAFEREVRADLDAVNVRIDMLREYVDDRLEDFAQHLPIVYYVKSPFTGEVVTVQEAINELFENGSRYRACTCNQFESLGLTCSEFDGLELTAYEFDMYGLDYLPFRDDRFYMYNPFNGEYTLVKEVVERLAGLHQLAGDVYTASEWDALELEAGYFDGLEISAYNLDWHDKTYITLP